MGLRQDPDIGLEELRKTTRIFKGRRPPGQDSNPGTVEAIAVLDTEAL
jgi:hypothetical protein